MFSDNQENLRIVSNRNVYFHYNNSLWYNAPTSVLYITSCKHSLVLLRMGETIARNMLS